MNHLRVLTLVVVAAAVSGCAQERDPIDRTQPNSYDKSYFDATWYYQRTVTDVPAANGFTFVGLTDFGGLERVTWDVQERFLYARRAYELLRHGDSLDRDTENGDVYEGEVIAAFPITSHFDITYAYNPSTGERLNVLEENSWDRPWYERQNIRVDWSMNLVHNYDLDFEAVSIEPVPYFVQEFDDDTGARNPDAPHFEPDYFDITNKLFAKAGQIDYPPYGMIPLCWLDDFMECGPGEYTIRHSFKRIDQNHQYEPFKYKGKMTEVFGFFWNDRPVYSENGVFTQNLERYLNRHNLWKKSYDADGNLIPYADRELKPIVYHVNTDWPSDDAAINDAARGVAEMWNDAFRDVVAATGYPLGANEDVYVFCPNNPVKASDPSACGAPGLSPRIGDLRYSFMAYVPDYMTYGLLGLGPSNTDPLTGETISGMAYVYHWNDVGAVRTLDMIDLLNGDENVTKTYIDGLDLTDWSEIANGNAAGPQRTYDLKEAGHMVKEMANGWKTQIWEGRRYQITDEDVAIQKEKGLRRWMEPHLQRLHQEGHTASNGDRGQSRLRRLAGTEIEDMMLTDDIYRAVGHDPSLPVDESAKARASVLRGGFGQFMKGRDRMLEDLAANKDCAYLPAMADDALMGLAREFKGKDLSREQMLYELRKRIYTAVLGHEVGHSLGLMHNFGGSDDAINYFDDYWAIRGNDGTILPRTQDPITQYEVDNKIYNYAYSSVMDYAGRYTIDGAGIGKYDRAAIMFGYAGKVEVFKDNKGVTNTQFNDWYDSDGDPLSFFGSGPEATHYTYYYNQMGDDMFAASNRELVDYTTMKDDFSEENGREGRPRVPYIYCSHSRSNLGDSCLTRDFGADASERMMNILDELNTWYIQRNFPRGDRHVDNWNYVQRYYGRVYDRMKQWHDIYGLYADFLPTFYTAQEIETFFNDDIGGWGTKTWAVQNAFNYLVQTVLMPDINDFALERQPDGKSLYRVSSFGGGSVVTDVTQARYFSTSWFPGEDTRECGYMFWECLHHVGFYLDKIMAIEALSDSETNFVGRSTPEDIREWEISYYSTFPQQISKLNSAIMGQDWGAVGPYWEGGQLKFPNYTGPLTDVHAAPVDPFATFTIQLYWQVLGRARFPNNYDVSFQEESRLWFKGTGLAPELPVDRIVEYVDPASGLTFQAATYNGTGAGEKLIARANAMKARSNECDSTNATVVTADNCVALEAGLNRTQVSAALSSWTEVLKTMVRVDQEMDWGDPYNP